MLSPLHLLCIDVGFLQHDWLVLVEAELPRFALDW
jgi:hypothetical protein